MYKGLSLLKVQILLLGRGSELIFHLTAELRCGIYMRFILSKGIHKNREKHTWLENFQNYESISSIEFVFLLWLDNISSDFFFFFFSYPKHGLGKCTIQSFPKGTAKAFLFLFFFSLFLSLSLSSNKLTILTPQQKDGNLYFKSSLTDMMNFDCSFIFMTDIILFTLGRDD